MDYVMNVDGDRILIDTHEVGEWVQGRADLVRKGDGPCSEPDANDLEGVANALKGAESEEAIRKAMRSFDRLDTATRDAVPTPRHDHSVACKAFDRLCTLVS